MPSTIHPSAELEPGTELAGCRIEGVAGRGGMGIVYRATQLDLGRPVALKLIAGERASDPAFRGRFALESRLAAAIDHPNVVPVHAAGEEDGRLYLVMRYVAGTDLHALLAREGRLEPGRAARIAMQVAAGLDAAHEAGLVHRDVKPGNVLLAGEHVYLGDFGLTRPIGSDEHLTETGAWVGTVDYMSPEHLRGERCDARSDVYALGCLLFALLAGEPPFRRQTVPATIDAHLHEPPPLAAVPREFRRVLARALAKSPEERFPSAGDLGRAALAAAEGERVTEEERTVARGAAAPPATEGGVARGAAAPPATEVRPASTLWLPPTGRGPRLRRRRAPVLAALAAGALAAATVATIGVVRAQSHLAAPTTPAAPLTEGDVRSAVDAFAGAVAREDSVNLLRVLSPGVQRVFPSDVQRGRGAVMSAYRGQFRASAITGYDIGDLQVQGGRVGRASGRYTLERAGRRPVTGRIVLDVVRVRGTPRIGLIAATPD